MSKFWQYIFFKCTTLSARLGHKYVVLQIVLVEHACTVVHLHYQH